MCAFEATEEGRGILGIEASCLSRGLQAFACLAGACRLLMSQDDNQGKEVNVSR